MMTVADKMDLQWKEVKKTDEKTGDVYRGWVADDGDREFVIIYSPVLGYSLGWCKRGAEFHEMQEIGVSFPSPEAAQQRCIEHRRLKMGN
jgi:hypothetical protein